MSIDGTDIMTAPIMRLNTIGKLQDLLELSRFDSPKMEWLRKSASADQIFDLYNFIQEEQESEEAKAFAKEGIEAFMQDGEVDFENMIINQFVGRSLWVYRKLKSIDLFTKTINSFEHQDKLQLYLKNGTLADCSYQAGAEGCTDGNEVMTTGMITIYIIDQSISPLEIAKNILHEGIHASMFRAVFEHQNDININETAGIMSDYLYYKGLSASGRIKPGEVFTISQHEYMAEHYVEPIAKALRELDNNSYDLDYYLGFGWFGLENTYNYKARITDNQIIEMRTKMNIVINNSDFHAQ